MNVRDVGARGIALILNVMVDTKNRLDEEEYDEDYTKDRVGCVEELFNSSLLADISFSKHFSFSIINHIQHAITLFKSEQ